MRNYGYDAFRFASFLAARGTDVVQATAEDIVAYRESRLVDAELPVSPATWQREVVVIRGIYNLLMQIGAISREPWITIGRSSALRTPWHSEPDIRPLTREQWVAFRDVGLRGLTSSGEMDPSWRGRSSLRSMAGAEIAVTTGMRVSEFSTLLDAELPTPTRSGHPSFSRRVRSIRSAAASRSPHRRCEQSTFTAKPSGGQSCAAPRPRCGRDAMSCSSSMSSTPPRASFAVAWMDAAQDGDCIYCHPISGGSQSLSMNMALRRSAFSSVEAACRSACERGMQHLRQRVSERSTWHLSDSAAAERASRHTISATRSRW